MNPCIFTIGHSTHSLEKFLGLLCRHEVNVVVDVRSQPYSRVNPQFNREALRSSLKGVGIGYLFLGRELGARSDDRDCYVGGKVQYDRLACTQPFQEGVHRVVQGSVEHRIALMCAEKDPLTCHRTILVSRYLAARGLEVQHILESGCLEGHEAAMARLLRELGMAEPDLFRSREELELEAYVRRGEQIAYVEKDYAAEGPAPRSLR